MSVVEIERAGKGIEFSRPSTNQSVIREDDGRDWMTVSDMGSGLELSVLDSGAGGEYARAWADIMLDREAALELRGFIDAWLDTGVSSD